MAAGYRSLLAFWTGGAFSPYLAPPAGVRSLLGFWVGGAESPVGAPGGYRSLLAFWSGGACGVATDAPPSPEEESPPDNFGGRRRHRPRHRKSPNRPRATLHDILVERFVREPEALPAPIIHETVTAAIRESIVAQDEEAILLLVL